MYKNLAYKPVSCECFCPYQPMLRFGVLMGYYVGKAKFDKPNSGRLLLRGLFWAVLFHGLYDFFLFLQGNPYIKEYISDLLLFVGAVASFVIAIRLSLRHIKQHRLLSQQTYQSYRNNGLSGRHTRQIFR